MTQADRDRRHRSQLERINRMQLVVGRGDRTRVDHVGTLLERARMTAQEMRSHEATEQGLRAIDRLLSLAEERTPAHARDIVEFIAAIWNNKPLSLATLRGLDGATGDDMLAVLDAFRWGRLSLIEHVEGGPQRVARVLAKRRLAARQPA